MESSVFNWNTKPTAVYYNLGKPPHLFRIHTDVTLSGLKDQLNQINLEINYRDMRRVDGVEYRRPSAESSKRMRLSRMKLMNDDDVRTMFAIFCVKGVHLNAKIIRNQLNFVGSKYNSDYRIRNRLGCK